MVVGALLTIVLLAADTASTAGAPSNNVVYILGALLGGGLIAGFVAYLRLRRIGPAEKEDLMNQVAARTVEIAETTMKRMETELKRAIDDRENTSVELFKQVEIRAKLEEQVKQLQTRVAHLERKLESYEPLPGPQGERGLKGDAGPRGQDA